MKTMNESTNLKFYIMAIIIAILFLPGMLKAGNLEPSAGPGPTMKTLDEIPPTWSQKLDSSQRFTLVLGGEAVLDKETGLVWERTPDSIKRDWFFAGNDCYKKTVGGRKGWRLPAVEELASLIDPNQSNPALPIGHPFQNLYYGPVDYYCSNTAYVFDSTYAYNLSIGNGNIVAGVKTSMCYVWAVRTGQ
jgi:hypothetical protein